LVIPGVWVVALMIFVIPQGIVNRKGFLMSLSKKKVVIHDI
jgi:hypothetical protein